jgi:hypothetical protein
VLAHQGQRRLVVEIVSLTTHCLMCFGKQCHRLAATVASLLAPRDPPLGGLERAFGFPVPAGRKDARAIGRVASASMPRSIPVSCPVGGSGCTGASAHEMATYQPPAS